LVYRKGKDNTCRFFGKITLEVVQRENEKKKKFSNTSQDLAGRKALIFQIRSYS